MSPAFETTPSADTVISTEQQPQPQQQPRVLVKFSENIKALKREVKNYHRVTNENTQDLFVEIHDFYNPQANKNKNHIATDQQQQPQPELKGQAALVMERGCQDLESYLHDYGPMQGDALQKAVATTAKAVQACHEQDMVWTELKATNFVICPIIDDDDNEEGGVVVENFMDDPQKFDFFIKAIDLESAVKEGDPPIDFSPEAIPPEFATAYLCGRE